MGVLLPARDEGIKQRLAKFFIAEAKDVPYNSNGQKIHAHPLIGLKGLVLEHYMAKETTIRSEAYCDLHVNVLLSLVLFILYALFPFSRIDFLSVL